MSDAQGRPKNEGSGGSTNDNLLSNVIVDDEFPSATVAEALQIVQGLKASIAHHTNSKGGTRSLAAETFVKDVITAAVWNFVSKKHKLAMQPIVDALGTNRNQLQQHGIDRAHALIDNNKQVEKYRREERKDKGFKKGKMMKHASALDPCLLMQQEEDTDFLHFSTNTDYNEH